MCLYEIDGQPFETRIANRDIVVWKGLNKTCRGNYVSPYQGTLYIFGECMRSKLIIEADGRIAVVGCGLHSCLLREDAEYHSDEVFPAIIPAGSKFIVGNEDEVASNALIVYEDMKQLQAVHGRVRDPVHVKNAGKVIAVRKIKS